MELKTYLKSLPTPAARDAFAKRCGTSMGHLNNVIYGQRPCSTEIAVSIEQETGGQVTRQELCPDTWRGRWPELVSAAQAG